MDLLTLNFGQLLQSGDNELKNITRNFEKQKQQIISAQYGILFNQTCLNEELYPVNANIYIYIYTINNHKIPHLVPQMVFELLPL